MITLHINEDMKIIGISSSGGSKENVFYSNTNRGGGGRTSSRSWHWNLHGGHHQHKCQPHGGGWGNFRGRGSHGDHGGSHRSQ